MVLEEVASKVLPLWQKYTTLSWRNARRHHGATVHSPRPTNRHSPPPKTAHPACKEKHTCPFSRKELT